MDPTEARSVATAVVVIPTYNECDNIASLAGDVRALGYRVLVVDDGSPDGTGAIVDHLAVADHGMSCLHRETGRRRAASDLPMQPGSPI